jgi:hypothetical protein
MPHGASFWDGWFFKLLLFIFIKVRGEVNQHWEHIFMSEGNFLNPAIGLAIFSPLSRHFLEKMVKWSVLTVKFNHMWPLKNLKIKYFFHPK